MELNRSIIRVTTSDANRLFSEALRFSVAVIGESGVGKSALINRFTTGSFNRYYSSTLEEFHNATMKLSPNDQEDYILDIVDTAGLSEFRSALSASLKKKKDAYMYIYNDVT